MFTYCAFADEAGPSLKEQIAAMKDNGISCMEVRNVDGNNFITMTKEDAREVRDRLADEGLSIWSIGSPLGKIGIRDPFEPHLDELKYTLELADLVGTKNIRMFSFYIPQGEDPEIYHDEVMERLSRFAEAAKGSGIALCHENEKGIYGDIAPRCRKILDAIPEIRCAFDPANFIQSGQDTLEAWDLLGKDVYYMHVKDALWDGRVVPAGRGDGHLPEIFGWYTGQVLTLEPHLFDFVGLSSLENGEKSKVGDLAFANAREAFDAAMTALKGIVE